MGESMFKGAGFLFALTMAASAAAAEHTYIVRLHGAPLLEHAHERAQERGAIRLLGEKTGIRRELQGADSAAYLRELDSARAAMLDAGNAALGRNLQPRHVFRHAANGVALTLSDAEAAVVAKLPGVAAIHRERRLHLLTDAGPQWIGADSLWNGQVSGVAATRGEGVVIGIIDTGINSTHPSFAAQGADGYAISNPRGHFYGLCNTGQATCNNKLIGIYDFTDEGTHGIDSVGHGSHVAGIAAGNALSGAVQGHTVALQRQVSGVAPHANVIMYKACVNKDAANPDGGCPESDLVAALDQATADGVDVINYSIGGDAIDPYALLDAGGNDAASMFQARAAGIVVVVAAGNEGPGPHSIDEPGNVPWVISVANASHNRRFANSLGDFSSATAAPTVLNGQGYTAGYGPASIVYAGDFGNALCGIGDSEGVDPSGASNPFTANTFHGEIVVCDRGTYARVEKGYNVLHAGAGGFVLANTAAEGEAIVSDDHFLPAVHLGYDEGVELKNWLVTPGSHTGKIAGVSAALDDTFGDILEASSSRGPTGFGVLKPDITAPGTNILSAARTGSGEALLTGTSMASPHVAGAAALIVAAHPEWSPAQVESALIGTALSGSVRTENLSAATPLGAGAGRVQPASAARAGLYLPLDANAMRAQDPAHGGKPENLNRAGIESESCFLQCSFTRTLADLSGGGTWQVSVIANDGAHVTVTPSLFTLAPDASQVLNIAVDVSDPRLPGTLVSGRIVLHKSTGGQSAGDFALPLAVYASPGTPPAFREFTTNRPIFDTTLNLSGLVALPQAQFVLAGLAPATQSAMSLGVDPTPNDLYSTFPGTGKDFVIFPVQPPSGWEAPAPQGRVFIVEIAASTSPLAKLYAGIDSNGNGQPDFVEQACMAQGIGARCIIDLHGASEQAQVWALIDIPSGTAGTTSSVTLNSGMPTAWSNGYNDHSDIAGPGHVPAGANVPLRMKLGSLLNPLVSGRYYGAIMIDAVPSGGMPGQIGFVPFALTRTSGGDDVVDALILGADGQRNYAIAAGESLRHSFVDIPDSRSIHIYTGAPAGSSMSFYLARSDIPSAAQAAEIAAAPPASSAIKQWSIGGSGPTEQAIVQAVGPGRWYVVATNTGSADGGFTLILNTDSGGTAVPTAPGAFFNPQRGGHGIFVSQAAGQQVVYWYTYLEDGTPTWYAAQADEPLNGAAAWSAPLFSVNWDGSQVNTYSVLGDMILTPLAADELEFSWHLFGDAGSERFTRLGPTAACVSLGSAQVNLDGQWFAPTQSGYGMDVLALPGFQQDTFYLYDALGMPHWLAGSTNTTAGSNTFPIYQLSGFCPSCNWVAPQTVQAGTMTASFSSGTQGHYTTQISLAPPLAGSWNIDQPTQRLTGSPACGP
jgi:subtilisin family serine protease